MNARKNSLLLFIFILSSLVLCKDLSAGALSNAELNKKLFNMIRSRENNSELGRIAEKFSNIYFSDEQIKLIEDSGDKKDTILDFVAYRAAGVAARLIGRNKYPQLFTEYLFYYLLQRLESLNEDELMPILKELLVGEQSFTRTIYRRNQVALRDRFIYFIIDRLDYFKYSSNLCNYLKSLLHDQYLDKWLNSDLNSFEKDSNEYNFAFMILGIRQALDRESAY